MDNSICEDSDIINLMIDRPILSENEDKFYLTQFAETISEVIINCPTPFTIGISGNWGSGKSSVLKLCENILLENYKNKIKIINYNAWKYNGDSFRRSLLLTLGKEIYEGNNKFEQLERSLYYEKLSTDKPAVQSRKEKIIDYIKLALPSTILLIILFTIGYLLSPPEDRTSFTQIIGILYGILLISGLSTINFIKSQINILEQKRIMLSPQKNELPYFSPEQFELEFHNIIDENENIKYIFFIDNLDRSSSEFVVKVLSDIKTFIEEKNCVFVFAFDKEALSHHIILEMINSNESFHKSDVSNQNENTIDKNNSNESFHKSDVSNQNENIINKNISNNRISYVAEWLHKIFDLIIEMPQTPSVVKEKLMRELLDNLNEHDENLEDILVKVIAAAPRHIKRILNNYVVKMRFLCKREKSGYFSFKDIQNYKAKIFAISALQHGWYINENDIPQILTGKIKSKQSSVNKFINALTLETNEFEVKALLSGISLEKIIKETYQSIIDRIIDLKDLDEFIKILKKQDLDAINNLFNALQLKIENLEMQNKIRKIKLIYQLLIDSVQYIDFEYSQNKLINIISEKLSTNEEYLSELIDNKWPTPEITSSFDKISLSNKINLNHYNKFINKLFEYHNDNIEKYFELLIKLDVNLYKNNEYKLDFKQLLIVNVKSKIHKFNKDTFKILANGTDKSNNFIEAMIEVIPQIFPSYNPNDINIWSSFMKIIKNCWYNKRELSYRSQILLQLQQQKNKWWNQSAKFPETRTKIIKYISDIILELNYSDINPPSTEIITNINSQIIGKFNNILPDIINETSIQYEDLLNLIIAITHANNYYNKINGLDLILKKIYSQADEDRINQFTEHIIDKNFKFKQEVINNYINAAMDTGKLYFLIRTIKIFRNEEPESIINEIEEYKHKFNDQRNFGKELIKSEIIPINFKKVFTKTIKEKDTELIYGVIEGWSLSDNKLRTINNYIFYNDLLLKILLLPSLNDKIINVYTIIFENTDKQSDFEIYWNTLEKNIDSLIKKDTYQIFSDFIKIIKNRNYENIKKTIENELMEYIQNKEINDELKEKIHELYDEIK